MDARRTVLIGLDGATFAVLDPLLRAGVMPFLRDLVARSARATLRSIVPPLTPPAWTSLVTGRTPGHHGVFDFFQLDAPGSRHIRFVSSHDVRAETIWSLASRQGLSVTSLNFPLTFPAPEVNGYVVPGGWVPWRQLRLACYPAGLYDRLKALPGFNAREVAMDASVEEKALEGCRDEEFEGWIELHSRRERHWLEILAYLSREDPSKLTAVMFDGVDKIQHLCWRFLDPESDVALGRGELSPFDRRVRELCLGYFRQLDGILAEIAALAGPEARLVVASDHGFGPAAEVFHVNSWLEREGYLTWSGQGRPYAAISSDALGLGMSQLARHTYLLDWERTRAYAATPAGNGVHVVVAKSAGEPGVPVEQYRSFCDELTARLLAHRDARGEPVVTRGWHRSECFAGPAEPLAPDLTLELRPGAVVSILAADAVLRPGPGLRGTHRPEGVFVAAGPGVRPGAALGELSILDVMPTLLYSLGLALPAELEGRLPLGAFEPAHLAAHPVVRLGPAEGQHAVEPAGQPPNGTDSHVPEVLFDDEAEAAMLSRLRALGYVN